MRKIVIDLSYESKDMSKEEICLGCKHILNLNKLEAQGYSWDEIKKIIHRNHKEYLKEYRELKLKGEKV